MAEKVDLKSYEGKKGEFDRFRNEITADGSSGFKAESGRYHLYVSLACPWANRTMMVRNLKGLEDCISHTNVHWTMNENGWMFASKGDPAEEATPDSVNNCAYIKDLYLMADKDRLYSGKYTLPILWDKKLGTIVNNKSAEIIRMLNAEFNSFCKTDEQRALDFYPEHLRTEIDQLNDWIDLDINDGVFKTGFAIIREAYESNRKSLFEGLDRIENILAERQYLTGNQFTEADIRLFPTLFRFDSVYHTCFNCNKKRVRDYPNIWRYTLKIHKISTIKPTVNEMHDRMHFQTTDKEFQASYSNLMPSKADAMLRDF